MASTIIPPQPSTGIAIDNSKSSSTTTMTVDSPIIDLATAHVHETIRSLLADEVPDLAESKGLSVFSDPYLNLSMKSFRMYLGFVANTWWGVTQSAQHLWDGQIAAIDFLTLVFFSTLVSFVLTLGVIMCLICKLPLVESVFGIYTRLNGGFSFINSLNTHMFKTLTKREVAHSKAALSSTAPIQGKHFNLEIAKMLLLLSSVVYERTADATRASLQAAHTLPKGGGRRKGHSRNTSTTSPFSPGASPTAINFPIIAPAMSNTSQSTGRRSGSLHASVQALHARAHTAGLPYLHSPGTSPTATTFNSTATTVSPSRLLQLFGKSASHIRALLHGSPGDSVITTLVSRLGLEYEPISELNSASSSYAAAFWDKRSNWVVLAFKGTSPAEFDEWVTDFDIMRVQAGRWVPGWREVHRGFKERLFPGPAGGGEGRKGTPYETIMKALRVVTRDLMSRTEKDINVWFTGHSLGCAMATLTYTRALLNLDGLDPRVQFCDAYLYGAPVVCDMASAKVFNEFMARRAAGGGGAGAGGEGGGRVRNVWRVTNHCDAVTTLLPMLGDDPLYPHPTSLFAYAHLGSEVKMRPGSGTSIIVDNYCTPGVQARVVTSRDEIHLYNDTQEGGVFGSDVETEVEVEGDGEGGTVEVDGYRRTAAGDERVGYAMSERERKKEAKVGKAKKFTGVPWWIEMLEYVPLAGRMVSHFPGLYFRSLQQMEPGDFGAGGRPPKRNCDVNHTPTSQRPFHRQALLLNKSNKSITASNPRVEYTRLALALLTVALALGTAYSVIKGTYLDTSNPLLAHLPHPAQESSYFARKSNVFNLVFVKWAWAWAWTVGLSGILALSGRSATGSQTPRTTSLWLWRITLATLVWASFTSWFFGPPLFDRVGTYAGAECVVVIPFPSDHSYSAIDGLGEASVNLGIDGLIGGRENGILLNKPIEYCHTRTTITPDVRADLFTSPSIQDLRGDLDEGWKEAVEGWQGGRARLYKGHDVSGHIFLLTMCILFLTDQVVGILYPEHVAPPLREGAVRKVRGPEAWAFQGTLGLLALWWWMPIMTSVYFHTPQEKSSGFLIGIAGFLITRIPYPINEPPEIGVPKILIPPTMSVLLVLPVEVWQMILRSSISTAGFLDPDAFEGDLSAHGFGDADRSRDNETICWESERTKNTLQRVCKA